MPKRPPSTLSPVKRHINQAVTDYRKQENISQAELARTMGCPRSLVSHIEGVNSQNKSYTIDHIHDLALFKGLLLTKFIPEKPIGSEE